MKKFFAEFKKFITKGNVMDLAVAFILGAAFKAIISSLVNDIFMPVISLIVGDVGFDNYKYVITAADETAGIAENAIYWGRFIQNVIDFILVAFVVFLLVRTINRIKDTFEKKKEEEEKAPAAPPKPTTEELLTDIKEILQKQNT